MVLFNKSKVTTLNANVANVQVLNHQIILTGTNLNSVTDFKIKNGAATTNLQIESKSDTSIVANTLANVNFAVGTIFDFVLSNANAASIFQVAFTNTNNSITASMLTSMGATKGQIMKYNGTAWVPSSITNAQTYLGTYDAATNNPDLSSPSSTPGDYFIVSVAGTFNSISYAVGDWIISDGYNWQKVANSAVVVSTYNGRRGIVTTTPADYVLLKNGSGKLTGSTINDLADVNISSPLNGSVLKYDSATSKWIVGVDNAGGGAYTGPINKAVITDGTTGALTNSTTTAAELGFVSGVTSSIQTQINAKQSSTLVSGNILVGSAGNVATGVAMSGDATIANTGAITLKNTGTAGTYTSVTTDAQGRVTAGTNPAVVASITATAPVTIGGTATAPIVSMAAATTAVNGYLTNTDWTIFNNKQAALSTGPTINGIIYPANGSQTLQIPLAPVALTDAVNKQYVDSLTAGAWSTIAGNIYRLTGGVGIGTTAPQATLDVNGAINIKGINGISFPATDSTTNGSIAIGANALQHQSALTSAAFSNTAVGYNAISGSGLTSAAIRNTAIGNDTLSGMSSGSYNTAIGASVFGNITTGSFNTAIGASSGYYLAAGSSNNTAIGYGAIGQPATTSDNTAIGTGAMYYANGVGQNVSVGKEAGYGSTGATTAAKSVFVGYNSGRNITTGNLNTALGYQAGIDLTTGGNNTILGQYPTTGVGVTTGSNNILIGQDIRPQSQIGSNQLNIGNLIYSNGLSSGATISTGSIGIGTTNPGERLTIAGGAAVDATGLNLGTIANALQFGALTNSGEAIGSKRSGGGNLNALDFYTNYNNRMTITNSGNVGVGTTSPQSKLDVNGSVKVGVDATACSATIAGAMRFNTPNVEFCNGASWASVGATSISSAQITDGTIMNADINASAAIDASKINTGVVSNAEFNFLDGVTSAIQTQIDTKEPLITAGATTKYFRGDKTFVDLATDVRGSTLTGLSSTAGSIAASDTVLGAFGKLLNTQSDYVSKSANTTITGTLTINSIVGALTVPSPINPNDAVNKSYVDGLGQWLTSSGNVYRSTGSVGIGTSSPGSPLDVVSTAAVHTGATIAQFKDTLGGAALSIIAEDYAYGSPVGIRGAGTFGLGFYSGPYRFFNNSTSEIMRIETNGNVGIGTNAPTNSLSIGDATANDGFILAQGYGAVGTGGQTLTTAGAGKRMIWYPKKAAFRVGYVSGTEWDDANIGNYSIAIGSTNIASNAWSTAIGSSNNTSTQGGTAIGAGNIVNGLEATALGKANLSSGTQSVAIGYDARATGAMSVALGKSANATGTNSMAFGIGNPSGSNPIVSGNNSFGVFLGDQSGVNITANNTMAILGGNVGIGTTAPGAALHIISGAGPQFKIGSGLNKYLTVNDDGASITEIQGYNNGNTNAITMTNLGAGAASIALKSRGTTVMTLKDSGNVGIGTTLPAYTLDVNGTVAGTSAYVNSSDERYKKDISIIPSALEKLVTLDGVFYNFRTEEFPDKKFSNRREMGVIAQSVEKVFPEAVTKDKLGFRSVAYSMLIAPIIESIKYLNLQMKELFKETATHSREIASLKAENDLLKNENNKKAKELEKMKLRLERIEKSLKL